MKTCVYICDKCGKEIKQGIHRVNIIIADKVYDFELCPDCGFDLVTNICGEDPASISAEGDEISQCFAKINSIVETDPEEMPLPEKASLEEQEEEELKKKEESPARKRIDEGKALALHNAGWNSYQIAQDMHITVQEAAEAVKRAKSKLYS